MRHDEPHTLEHVTNPVAHNEKCETCNAILRRAFNDIMPGLELGPTGADMLLRRINEIARQLWAEDAAS